MNGLQPNLLVNNKDEFGHVNTAQEETAIVHQVGVWLFEN